MEKNYITTKEVADMLKASVSTIYSYASAGKLPTYKVVGRILFNKEEIEEYIESCKVPCKIKIEMQKETTPPPTFKKVSTEQVLAKLDSLK